VQTQKEKKQKSEIWFFKGRQRAPLILEDKKEVCANLEAKDI